MIALVALLPLLSLVAAAPSRLDRRDASTSDWLCQQDNRAGPAAIVTVNGASFCGCTGDVPIGAAGLSVKPCEQISPPYQPGAALQNVCMDSRTGPYCATNCAYGFERNPRDGTCVKAQPVSSSTASSSSSASSSTVTSVSSSHYCGYGVADNGRCNPPPASSTSLTTTYYCNGGPCISKSTSTSKPSWSSTTYSTTFYCNGGPCISSPTVPPHSRSSSASASSTSSAPVSSITGSAGRLATSGSALIGALALVGLAL